MPTLNQINEQLDRIAAVEPGPYPVLSLYLDLRTNDRGRERVEPFLRTELPARLATYRANGSEANSLQRDSARTFDYLATIDPAANGVAIFACDGIGFFEAIPLAAPVGDHRVAIADQPYVYPLARVLDEYPRYLAVVADTQSARIFVFALNATERREHLESTKTRRHKMGGWSQARYQRSIDQFRQQHARDIVAIVARVVREEGIDTILLAGDEVIVPLLRNELPKELAQKVVDVLSLDIRTGERAVLEATLTSMRARDARTDRERVDSLIGAFRAGGLATVGEQRTRRAFELGQVDELLITANADDRPAASELVLQARHTGAGVRFIEDVSLLEPVGGVGAFLRFSL